MIHDPTTAERWGLVNTVVPAERLLGEARQWAADLARMSPTAIRFCKHSFNADTAHQAGLANMASSGLELVGDSDEGREGTAAVADNTPDFARQLR